MSLDVLITVVAERSCCAVLVCRLERKRKKSKKRRRNAIAFEGEHMRVR